ncbi:MAG: hypothetical protein ABI900_13620 [Betaproteobacteria bacterium]
MAMIVPELYRVFGSLGSFGLVADNDGVVVDVVGPFATPAESPAVAAGIALGDRIDLNAMRCVPRESPHCRSLLAVLGGLGGSQVVLPGRVVELLLERSERGPVRTVRLEAVRYARGSIDRLILLVDTLVGIIVILAACRLVWIRPGRMTWGFFLYAIWFNPGQTYAYYALLQGVPAAVFAQEIAEALAHGAGYAGLLIFALRFPNDESNPQWRRFKWMPPVVALLIAALLLASFANAFGFHTERVTSAAFLAGYAVDAIVLFVLLLRRRTLPAQDQQRMLWVIWGCAIGLPAFIFAEVAQSTSLLRHALDWSPSNVVVGLLYLLNGVLAYFVSVAVLRRRVVNVSIPLRNGTIVTVLSLALAIPIVNLHEMLSHFQEESFRLPEWVWLLIVAPIALLLLQRLHEITVEVVDRVLNRRFHAARQRLIETGAAVSTAHNFDQIDRSLVDTPVEALALSSGAVFRQEDHSFRRRHAIGWNASPLHELRRECDAAVLRSVETLAPVRLSRDGWVPPGLISELQAPCLAVPVYSDALGVIAIVLLGPHENGNDIDPDECEMLSELAARAAAGYERVAFRLLRDEVTELRARVVALQAPG